MHGSKQTGFLGRRQLEQFGHGTAPYPAVKPVRAPTELPSSIYCDGKGVLIGGDSVSGLEAGSFKPQHPPKPHAPPPARSLELWSVRDMQCCVPAADVPLSTSPLLLLCTSKRTFPQIQESMEWRTRAAGTLFKVVRWDVGMLKQGDANESGSCSYNITDQHHTDHTFHFQNVPRTYSSIPLFKEYCSKK
ncbi:hypothetical protein E1301_Tti016110 [Triplophysa tibetana]|uniref:Uncharacterized protein n=1 Tax=Triplophysa tibetana TaxID=1572043 RepID=A0A5A9P0H0_9TELE|nr:hypothetical protein E1301_Tti016110 [Triplophysa tibetana]